MKFIRILLCLFLSVLCYSPFAQINEAIKKKSDENQSNKNNSFYSDEYYSNDLDIGACCDGCLFTFDFGFLITEALSNAQKLSLSKKEKIPRISSFYAQFEAGRANLWNWSLIPEISFTHGIYATEIRVYQSFEKHINGQDNYGTFDWQILNFNLVNTSEFNWRIGTGFMNEFYSSKFFHESTMSFAFYPTAKLEFSFGFRLANDYETNVFVRQEFNFNLGYTIYTASKLNWIGFLSFTRANYYESVKFNIYSAGVKLHVPF